MKLIGRCLLLVLFIALAVTKSRAQVIKTYEQQWKKVDALIQKRALPKTALEEVRKIYTLAKKEGQDAQVIKALVYTIHLQQENREEAEAKAIKELEKELAGSKEPAASILKSLLAQRYWQYFQRHRWNLYQRTATTNFNKEDIATWTLEDFHKKISALYLQSISNEALLKRTSLAPFDALIIKGNVRHLRPTLYDLLAHQALTYFKSPERDLKKPSYAFEISQPEAFAPATDFVTARFTTQDSLSLQHKALLIYQRLLRFHLTDAKPDALIDADLDRIAYVYQNAVMEGKDTLYVQALNAIRTKYKANPAAHQAHYLLAAFYEQQAALYNPLTDTAHRYDRLTAKAILEQVVRDSTVKSEGWTNSYNLLKTITQPSFSFEVEKVNVPAQPFRALVKYRNAPQLHFRIIQSNSRLAEQLKNRPTEKYWDTLVSITPLKSWQQQLPATNDLQEHAAEVKLDALPVGEYILLGATNNGFSKKSGQLGAQFFYVSNISYVTQRDQLFVLHRQTGQPLAKAVVDVFTQVYNYKTYGYNKVKQASYTTDKNGYVKMNDRVKDRNYNYILDIAHGSDSLNLDETFYTYYHSNNEKEIEEENTPKKIFFFTDRSIYRPGQTVYFKGIVLNQNKKGNSIVTAYTTKVFLEDANTEDVDSVTVTTNEYGSFSGKFQLPQNVLNGAFTIYDEGMDNEIQFSVEEYKRPKFYVDFEKIKQTYKVGDSITITGNAKAYAGNVVDGAQVAYRVVRQPRFIYPWLFRGGWLPPVQPMEITHGETTTDNNGQFTITFKAIPDLKVNKKWDPLFDYRILADITDINGETRSGEQVITAGYKALLLKVNTAERVVVDSFKNISIRTENLNGEFQPSIVTTTLTQLIPEQRLVRNRYWQQPDQFVLSKEEFVSFFPLDEYRDESDYRTWQKGATVFTKTDSTKSNGQWSINNPIAPGFYSIQVVTKDRDGNEVKDVRYVELFDAKSNKLSAPEYLWTKGFEKVAAPGDKAQLHIGSAATDVFLIQQLDKPSNSQQTFSFLHLNNERKIVALPVSAADRGGFGVDLFFVKHNRFYQFSDAVNVPWTNKELDVTYTTFRDKTLPGSEEKWTVKITGAKGEKAAAEMLASMYDASLDQFQPHNWSKPGIWPVYARTFSWNGTQNFASVTSNQRWANHIGYKEFIKTYDQLIFDQYGNRPAMVRLRGARATAAEERVQDLAMTDSAAPALQGSVAGVQVQANKELQEVVVAGVGRPQNIPGVSNPQEIQIRKNFNETAFFFPHLQTDKEGNITFSFTMPEALTRWKLQTLAHTKELAFGLSQKELITQKQLMVQPNAPRFLRQGDRMEFSAKIVNLSGKELTGQAQLELVDATTNQSVDGWFQNVFPNQYFTVAEGQSEVVKFPIEVPYLFNNALVWRVVARAENFSDGEESSMPVLTNKILVTETLPLPVRGNATKNFTFNKLLKANSETLQHHAVTVEYTANPAWYAVQALPYLMEFPYDCAEQVWNRYYANALATMMVGTSPRMKQIFEKWKNADTAALLSNLQKNEELKSVLLQETPWVLQAKTEKEQKKNIALLFDMVRMSNELKGNLEKLKATQSENGGFVWFKGGPDDRYITQYIITGIGHLKKLKSISKESAGDLQTIIQKGIPYLDKKIKEDYERLLKNKADLSKQHIGYMQIQYLYMRSFYTEVAIPQSVKTAYSFYRKQAQQYWMKGNKYMQGMTALALNRTADLQTPEDILRSLKETAVTSEELGMYWNEVRYGYSPYWWQAPIETQALLVEAFTEISNDTKTVDNLRTWLIKNKQTTNWRTTKATAEAVYALLLQGTDWLSSEPVVHIKLGGTTVTNAGQKSEAGTGYFKQTIEGAFVKPEMGNISISVTDPVKGTNHQATSNPSWGAVYWQYFEDMDKISTAATPLQLAKKLFVEKNTDRGPVLSPVAEGDALQVGDKLKVRIELRVDRDMEYVHMKDLRASALEPVNVLSGYKWQGGLGYYETTKDASTNFFFHYLRKGTYVFEYPLFVTHAGNFSNGMTTIQSMYAPEFSAHSEGIRINVE